MFDLTVKIAVAAVGRAAVVAYRDVLRSWTSCRK